MWKNAICEKTSLHGWFNARAQDIHWKACKCHLIGSTNELADIQIGDFSIKNSVSEKLLGVNIDSKLNFDCHVNHLCNKANKKLRALARVTSYMTLEKKKIVMNSFFNAQFNYCPLIWILHSHKNNNKIKHLHERCLQLI